MKKKIISLMLIASLSFQSTYPLFQGVKESFKSKKAQALALLKKYKPKGIIARFKEANKAYKDAQASHNMCMKIHCANEMKKLDKATRKEWRPRVGYVVVQDYAYRKAESKNSACSNRHCAKELKALRDASKRKQDLEMAPVFGAMAIVIAWGLFLLGAVNESASEKQKDVSVQKDTSEFS